MRAVVEGLDLSGLSRLLSCADPISAEAGGDLSLEGLLFSAFGLGRAAREDWPVAAVTSVPDGGIGAADGWWLRADPVHLSADAGDLVLRDPLALNITMPEAEGLTAEINAALGDDGFHIEALAPSRWYVRLDQDPGIVTHSPSEAANRRIGNRMPGGPARSLWHRRLNEVQMVLHAATVNEAREARGEVPVNSVWFWGAGSIPGPGPAPAITDVSAGWVCTWGDATLLEGLAGWSGCRHSQLPVDANDWIERAEAGAHLVLIDSLHQFARASALEAWREGLALLEAQWFEPLRVALRERRLAELTIALDAPDRFRLSARGTRRWWRRTRPFAWFAGRYAPGVSNAAPGDPGEPGNPGRGGQGQPV